MIDLPLIGVKSRKFSLRMVWLPLRCLLSRVSQSRTEESMQQGALNIICKRQGEFWLIIVGEAPAIAIRQLANSIEPKNK